MNTISAVALTFIQLAIVISAMYVQRVDLTHAMLIYGSPVYWIVNIGDVSPHFFANDINRLYLLTFQTFKYFFLIRAFTQESHSVYRLLACIFEAAYLAISCFYILPNLRKLAG